jgi:Protein of unknown function (DUF2844)
MISNPFTTGIVLPGALRICLVGVALVLVCVPAGAELGGSVSSIQADQEHMKGTRRVTEGAAYSVHEIQAATGTMVREFVSPSGTVFGVAWNGPSTPDLQQLLGTYFGQYAQAIQSKRAARGRLSIRQEGLVVEAGGHMRSFSGRAYLPQMMPQGVASGTVK